jgi:hypothetical protein
MNRTTKMNTAILSAFFMVVSIAATFSGWLVLSVVHPPPTAQTQTATPMTVLPVLMRDPIADAPQPVAITRSSR